MVNINEIEAEIISLEKRDTSYATIERLAWLYICRDHLNPPNVPETYKAGGSPFLEAVNGAPVADVFQIIDEHMEAIRALYPREYGAILERIKNIKT